MKAKRRIIPVLPFLAACLMSSPSRAATINVPGDHATIQAAITAAAEGDTIQIAAGTYTEALSLNKSLTLIGSGPAAAPTTIITHATSTIISLSTTHKDFTFQNLVVEGNATYSNLGIRAASNVNINSLTLRDVIARHCKVAIYCSENYSGGAFQPATIQSLLFDNVTLTDNSHIGAYIGKAVISGTVTNSTITNNGFTNADSAGWQKVGLQFVDFHGGAPPRVQVSNTSFANNGTGDSAIEKTGLSFYTATNVTSAQDLLSVAPNCSFSGHYWAVRIKDGYNVDNTATVDGTFTGNYLDIWFRDVDGTTSSTTNVRVTTAGIRTVGTGSTYDYQTIQAAIDAASSGETIRVADGTYNENLNVTKALTLVSVNGRDAVTIQGGAAQSTALGGGNVATVCISSPDVRIGTTAADGFTIRGYDVATPAIEHAAVYIATSASSGLAVIGNHIVADGEAALLGNYGSPSGGIEVAHNLFSGQTYVGTTIGGNSSVQFTVHNVPRSMIYFSGNTTSISFHDNTVTGSVGGPIEGGGGTTYYNTGATIDCNGATSLATGAVIDGNVFTIPSWAALRARGPYSTVTDNIFDSSGAGGLVVGTYYQNTSTHVYSGNQYISGPGSSTLAGDGSSSVVLPGDLADYTLIRVSTPTGSVVRATGPDRVVTMVGQATAAFDDHSLDLATADLEVVRPVGVAGGYATIQAAIDAAVDDDVINVYPGNYSETASGRGDTADTGPYQFGLFFPPSKSGITVQGVKADGTPVTDTDDIAAFLTTNATNSFGPSGVFVSGDGMTLRGIEIGNNTSGTNKAIEVIGDGFTLDACRLNTATPLYIGDFSYNDAGTPEDFSDDVSSIQSYTISNCHFLLGDVYIANGAGWTGASPDSVTGRSITDCTFEGDEIISFAGMTPGTGWLLYPTGAATISGNAFVNTGATNTRYIQSWGAVQAGHPYADYWNDNTFPRKTITTTDGNPANVRGYDSGSFYNIKRIGNTIQQRITYAQAGDVVLVGAGMYPEDVAVIKTLTLQGSGPGVSTIKGPLGGDGMTVKIAAANVKVDGFTITRDGNNPTQWNDPNLNNAGGVHIQNVANATITNNEILGNRTGIDINNSSGHMIRNNRITNNRTGMILRNTTNDLVVTENEITGNWTVGILFLDGSGGTNSPPQTAANCVFSNNDISGNWYGQIVDRQTGGSLPAPGSNAKNFENNWLGTTAPSVSTANSGEPGYSSQIPVVFGGTATPPAIPQPDILGSASANIDYIPLLASGVDTDVETTSGRGTYGFQGDIDNTISNAILTNLVISNQQQFGSLLIGANTTVTVTGSVASLEVTGELGLATGAVLEVINGSLTINGSTLSGTFTFFNSLGSVNFNADVAITGSADGLILVSDVHVADGATITVDGTLVIDGSVIDCQVEGGSYTIDVNSGASFTMARTVMTDGVLDLAANDSKVYDNRFETSTVTVASGTSGARVYHNLTDSLGWLTNNGTGTVTEVDGWGNLDNPSATQNNLFLGLDPGTLVSPTNGRTVDAEGTLFIQPSDSITASLDVSALQSKIAAVEVLLGYNTGLLGASALALETDWNVLITGVDDDSTVIGKLDAAIGLSTTYADPAGSDADDTIAKVALTGQTVEGETVFFHRVKLVGDAFGGETRLATGGPSPAFLTPFTLNSASIVLDGSDPTVIVNSLVNATQVQVNVPSPVDVLEPSPAAPPAYAFRNGQPLVITFTASDAGLAGLDAADAADAVNDLELSATNGSTLLDSWTVAATEDTLTGVVTYTVTLALPATATNGLYTVTADVRDRSGNWSGATALGNFAIANELLATVELEGFSGGNRVVTFIATGGTLKTWVKTVTFTGTTGSVTLEDVPPGTTHVSAKTAWNLRSKVAAAFTPEGVGTASLTATNRLPGGDLNGDNVVNTLDYSILRFYWLTANPTADIDGSGSVSTGDYSLLRGNFYTTGDPQ